MVARAEIDAALHLGACKGRAGEGKRRTVVESARIAHQGMNGMHVVDCHADLLGHCMRYLVRIGLGIVPSERAAMLHIELARFHVVEYFLNLNDIVQDPDKVPGRLGLV